MKSLFLLLFVALTLVPALALAAGPPFIEDFTTTRRMTLVK